MENKDNKKNRLAHRVLETCRNQLLFEHRFLEQALFRLKMEESKEIRFGTEGMHLFFCTDWVLREYIKGAVEMMWDYLHTVIHCLYQHPFFAKGKHQEVWNLAADISAESILMKFMQGSAQSYEEMLRRKVIAELEMKCGLTSVQKIYAYLLQTVSVGQMLGGLEFPQLSGLFRRDVHDLWYPAKNLQDSDQKDSEEQDSEQQGSDQRSSDQQGNDEQTSDVQEEGQDSSQEENQPHGWGSSESLQRNLQQSWKDVAEHMLMELKAFDSAMTGKLPGELAGDMIRRLQLLTREKYDYSAFLRKFACLEEKMQTNDDEFDYIFYTYGLRLFEKVPLIEPLEYKETYLIREFIIAIDTSGSCEGELVEKFLTKTYNILQQTESFTSKVNIHVLQCDCKLQDDAKLGSLREFGSYIRKLTLRGFGGTDFRPVFEYVDQMLKCGEMKRVDGLIYFTDGYGTFPHKPPKYKTAFVFLEKEKSVKVPPWAMQVYLDKEEFV